MTELVAKPHPFLRGGRFIDHVDEGRSIRDLMDDLRLPDHVLPMMSVWINEANVPMPMWEHTFPKKDARVVMMAVPQGGDGGGAKNALALVAVIALSIYAPGLGGALAGGLADTAVVAGGVVTYGQLATAGITLVGTLLIGALFAPPKPSGGAGGGQSYTITGQSNVARYYQPIPRVYGKMRIFPDVAAQPFIVVDGDDEYFHGLYCFGYGSLAISDIRIGTTALDEYQDVNYRVHENFDSKNDLLEIFKNDVASEAHGDTFLYDTSDPGTSYPVQHTTLQAADQITVDIMFPEGLRRNRSDGTTNSVKVIHTLRLKPTKGSNWTGINGMNPVFSGEVIIPTLQIIEEGGIFVEEYVWDDQNQMFVWEEIQIFNTIKQDSETIFVNSDYAVSAYSRIVIGGDSYTNVAAFTSGANIPVQLTEPLRRNYTIADVEYYTDLNGDDQERTVPRDFIVGGGSAATSFTVERDTGRPFTLGLTFDPIVTDDTYDIEITRWSNYNPDAEKVRSRSVWRGTKAIKHISPVNVRHPLALLEIKIRANGQLNGQIDSLNAMAVSRLITQPGNVVQETENPAWIYRDILAGTANNRALPDSRIDDDRLIEWAAFCDRDSPTGHSSAIKYFTCNFINTSMTTVWEMLQRIGSCGRAAQTVIDGQYSVIFDEANDISSQLFTQRNAWGFSSTRTYIDQPHAMRMKFQDAASDYQQMENIVYADGYNEAGTDGNLEATLFEEIELFGTAYSDQAWRNGRYYMAEGILRQEVFTLQTDIENLICLVGDKVEVSYDVPRVGGMPSRIQVIDGVRIRTDELMYFAPGKSYAVTIRKADGTLVSSTCQEVPGQYFAMNVPGAIPGIAVGDLLTWGEINYVTDDYKVKEIRPGVDLTATLTLVPYAPEIFDADTGPLPEYNPRISPLPGVIPIPPAVSKLLFVTENIEFIERLPFIDIVVSWEMPQDSPPWDHFEVWYRDADEVGTSRWKFSQVVDGKLDTASIRITEPDSAGLSDIGRIFDCTVIAVNVLHQKIRVGTAPFIQHQIIGDKTKPEPPTFFELDVISETIQLTWILSTSPDINHYVVNYSPLTDGTATWETSTTLIPQVSWSTTTAAFQARTGTYLMKAVDTSGNYSEDHLDDDGNPVSGEVVAITSIPDLIRLNTITVLNDEATAWNGFKDGVERNTPI